MKIADILRKHNLPKQVLARYLFLSRPTLDEYIEKYESGIKLPKGKYQIIFDALFSEDLDNDAFNRTIQKYRNMLERDRATKLDDLSAQATDKMFEIINCLKQIAGKEDDISFLNFALVLSRLYLSGDKVAKLWCTYVNELNNYTNKQSYSLDERKYLGELFDLNYKIRNNPNLLDETKFRSFLKRRKEINAKHSLREAEVQTRIQQLLEKRIKEEIEKSSVDETTEEIIERVLSSF